MKHLFSDYDIHSIMQAHERQMIEEIDAYSSQRLLQTSTDSLVEYFLEKYRIPPLVLHAEDLVVDVTETRIDVRNDRSRDIRDRSRPAYVPGTQTMAELPFSGERDLFEVRASQWSTSPPLGLLTESTVRFITRSIEPDVEKTKKEIERWKRELEKHAERLRRDLEPWNAALSSKARSRIEFRKSKLLSTEDFAQQLGYPLKKRADAPATYVPDSVRKKAIPTPPEPNETRATTVPSLSDEQYGHILGVIEQTARMLERSPKAFREMNEEQLRDQFLVPLNSHYEGQATGETFNMGGKSDILVRDGDKCLFIAECKVWRGQKSLGDAIDQLLGYTTWRDTKTAILVFNRDRKLTGVLGKVPEVIEGHPNLVQQLKYPSETGFQFTVSHPNDSDRIITVTILVYDIPA